VTSLLSFLICNGKRLQNGHQVFLDGESSKDGFFLGQVADPPTGPTVHGHSRDIFTGKLDGPRRGLYESDQHVETGGFPGPVRSQKSHNFPGADAQVDAIDDIAIPIPFHQTITGKNGVARRGLSWGVLFLAQGFCSITRLAPSVSILSSSG